MTDGVWFVYRSHYEGPLSKRVRRLPAPSVLAWFQAQIEEARTSLDPSKVGEEALGGPVHGLGTLFSAAKEHSLHTPKTAAALRKMLIEHLHDGGDPHTPGAAAHVGHVGEDNVRLDAHTLRVATTDNEVGLAYYFFDDEAVRKSPERVAYLLLDEPRLPDDAPAESASPPTSRPFAPPVEVSPFAPSGSGEGMTYACLLTFHDSDSLPGTIGVFPGVRLPGLAAHLRAAVAGPGPRSGLDAWPIEVRLLRAMLDEGDAVLAPALTRAAAYPLTEVAARHAGRLGTGAFSEVRAEFLAAAEGLAPGGDPAKAIVHESAHAAFLAAHTSNHFGFQQWMLFDDRWAAAHPDLAASILRYGREWDPFAPTRAPKAPKLSKPSEELSDVAASGHKSLQNGAASGAKPKAPAEPKAPKEPKPARSPKSVRVTRASAAAEAAAAKHDQAWKSAVAGRGEDEARAYAPSVRFAMGELIHHTKFGLGVVIRSDPTKLEALFAGAPRILVQGLSEPS